MKKFDKESLKLHKQKMGKWESQSKVPLKSQDDLSVSYTPGVAAVCEEVHQNPEKAYELTMKGNTVAVVSNGTSVLGLGDIGPEGALPVMEGKAILFKEFAGVDAVPLVINAKSVDEVIAFVKMVAPGFGGINLEDIKAPDCFLIEEALQDIGIPVFHDDQHGTAIVLLAALLNACKLTGKQLHELTVVINGSGAAGIAIAKLLRCVGHGKDRCTPVRHTYVCDSKGLIHKGRKDLNPFKKDLLAYTNPDHRKGSLDKALHEADVFIGVSRGNLLKAADIRKMAPDPIIFALANPIPEIMPSEAKKGGAAVIGTGRSDLPNQINNVLAFPGIFRGALMAKAPKITEFMKLSAAYALANMVEEPTPERILPGPLELGAAAAVAEAVKKAAQESL